MFAVRTSKLALFLSISSSFILVGSASAQPASNRTLQFVDQTHSSISFSVVHLGLAKVRGNFARWSGALVIDQDDLSRSSASIVIDVGSVDTGHERRDQDLRSDSYLKADSFPLATFQSTGVRVLDDAGAFVLDGEFHLSGVTRNVEIEFRHSGSHGPMMGMMRTAFVGTLTISREDFGITDPTQMFERLGFMGDEVEIELSVIGIQPYRSEGFTEGTRPSLGAMVLETLETGGLDDALEVISENSRSREVNGSPFEMQTLLYLLVDSGRKSEATALMTAYAEAAPNPLTRFLVGEALLETDQQEAAEEHFAAMMVEMKEEAPVLGFPAYAAAAEMLRPFRGLLLRSGID